MNNDNNMMPGIGDTATQKERHNGTGENKKNRARRNISAEAAHILKFLSSCTLVSGGCRACDCLPCDRKRQVWGNRESRHDCRKPFPQSRDEQD